MAVGRLGRRRVAVDVAPLGARVAVRVAVPRVRVARAARRRAAPEVDVPPRRRALRRRVVVDHRLAESEGAEHSGGRIDVSRDDGPRHEPRVAGGVLGMVDGLEEIRHDQLVRGDEDDVRVRLLHRVEQALRLLDE